MLMAKASGKNVNDCVRMDMIRLDMINSRFFYQPSQVCNSACLLLSEWPSGTVAPCPGMICLQRLSAWSCLPWVKSKLVFHSVRLRQALHLQSRFDARERQERKLHHPVPSPDRT